MQSHGILEKYFELYLTFICELPYAGPRIYMLNHGSFWWDFLSIFVCFDRLQPSILLLTYLLQFSKLKKKLRKKLFLQVLKLQTLCYQ